MHLGFMELFREVALFFTEYSSIRTSINSIECDLQMALWLELLVVPASAQQPITKNPRILVKSFDAREVAWTNTVSWSMRQAVKGRCFAGVNVLNPY